MDTKLQQALDVRQRAYCPYSHYQVGAVVEALGGELFAGCNAETASYTETDHAERAAISQAIAAGMIDTHGTRFIRSVTIVHEQGTPPCGGCRQRIAEHAAPDTVIISATPDGAVVSRLTLAELLPHAFSL